MQELLQALTHGNLVLVKKLLSKQDIDLSQEVEADYGYELEDPDMVHILFFAIYVGASTDTIKALMDAGADITYTNSDGVGIIDVAIKHKRRDLVELCIDNGVNPSSSQRRSGITPLILAASFNDIDMVKYLISRGASIDEVDSSGFGAKEYAKKMGQKSVLKYLESL